MTKQNIHQITLPTPYAVGDVHVYVVKGETVTLIDAGVNTKEAWDIFCDELKNIDLKPEDIDQVVLTHHHPDHIGFIGKLDHVNRVYGHELTQLWLTRDESYFEHYLNFFNKLYDQWGVPEQYQHIEKTVKQSFKFTTTSELTHVLTEGDKIPGLESFITLETPGHAESHLSFYNPETQALLAGDFLLKHISSNPLLEPPVKPGSERPKPLLHYRDSMRKVLDYQFSNIYPGHGEIFTGHEPLIKERLVKQEKRAHKVLDFIQKGPATPFEICQFLFPKHYQSQFGLTMSETVGQLDYLIDTGQITEVIDHGHSRFIANHAVTNN
ncbi:MBL fold metallo-hydrolase [Tenuibacillus multivorans]|uniref:Glyoxylase, beta-lactamase superfamily II n=1 Tax=Tenuibacillus multivorans TaxID=237069 RepID=A0A1H0D1T2_9BACI|nr:MBL fold metallo-hydrolase [Tenuibacillus multivorans]GEL76075.1 hydrolase [Tenuibacillus multivorans]SDN64147.1 Glyoxylase, beta-lactamase superfamily II [Tenuibacillus multivorans]